MKAASKSPKHEGSHILGPLVSWEASHPEHHGIG